MASTVSLSTLEQSHLPDASSPPVVAPATDQQPALPVDGPVRKLRGRQRLIHHIQRISSSPSLAQLGRRRGTNNPYSTRGSLSCVSLASASSGTPEQGHVHGHLFASAQASTGGDFTAPTSAPSTPDHDHDAGEERLAVRVVKGRIPGSECTSPNTIPVPADISRPISRGVLLDTHPEIPEIIEDYFSSPAVNPTRPEKEEVDFWGEMPQEIRLAIFSYLQPKELVRASGTSKMFHELCFDGQLWTTFDASTFYSIIPAESLSKIVVRAGPFIKNLNLRGCVQMEHHYRTETIVKACKNLMSATLEGCRHLSRSSIECLLSNNAGLKSLNLTALLHVNNKTLKIIAANCPQLETINVSWCRHVEARGFLPLLSHCPRLADIRAGEIRGFNNLDVASAIFQTNTIERLLLSGCTDLDDDALGCMMHGKDPEIDILNDLPLVPPRNLRDLDLSHCTRLSSVGIQHLAHMVPRLTGLKLSGCMALTDTALEKLLATTPNLTHLELEELSELTDDLLSKHLAASPCIDKLQHLSLSYCENLGDRGLLSVVKAAKAIRLLEVDNTRISDLVLTEAAGLIKARNTAAAENPSFRNVTGIRYGLRLICYDCQNVSWTGVREILSRNAEDLEPRDGPCMVHTPESSTSSSPTDSNVTSTTSSTTDLISTGTTSTPAEPASPHQIPNPPPPPEISFKITPPSTEEGQPPPVPNRQIISLKTFYGWQPTVNEHTRRVLSNDFAGARRLERKWADWMIATEEMNTAGGGMGWVAGMGFVWNTGNGGVMGRRRRRRAREAERLHVAEEEGGGGGIQNVGGGAGAAAVENGNGNAVGLGGAGAGAGQTQGQGGAGGIGGRRRRARSGCAMM